jgi:hypothetical protein
LPLGDDLGYVHKSFVDGNTLPGSPIYLNDIHFKKDNDSFLLHLWDFSGKDSMVFNLFSIYRFIDYLDWDSIEVFSRAMRLYPCFQ